MDLYCFFSKNNQDRKTNTLLFSIQSLPKLIFFLQTIKSILSIFIGKNRCLMILSLPNGVVQQTVENFLMSLATNFFQKSFLTLIYQFEEWIIVSIDYVGNSQTFVSCSGGSVFSHSITDSFRSETTKFAFGIFLE